MYFTVGLGMELVIRPPNAVQSLEQQVEIAQLGSNIFLKGILRGLVTFFWVIDSVSVVFSPSQVRALLVRTVLIFVILDFPQQLLTQQR